MNRQLLVELPEELAANAETEAKRLARPIDAVVQEALVEYLGWRAVEQIRAANADLGEASADHLVRSELEQVRAERSTS